MVHHAIISVSRIDPHPDNYNRHPQEQIKRLRQSVHEFAQVRSIVVQEQAGGRYTCVAGHGFMEAARLEGITELSADIIPSDWPPQKVKAYLIADNAHARLAEPDNEQLAAILQELADENEALLESAGYTAGELDALLARIGEGQELDYVAMWQGMPEFEQEAQEAYKTIKVHFQGQKRANENLKAYRVEDES